MSEDIYLPARFSDVSIHTEISLEIETKYIFWSNAFDLKEKFKGKVSKRLSYFHHLSKKVVPIGILMVLQRKITRILLENH